MTKAKLTSEEELTRNTYDSIAKQWSSVHIDSDFWKHEMDRLQKHLPGGNLLEIGCGGGRDARELIKRGYMYTGTDVSKGLLAEAIKTNPGHHFAVMSVYDLRLPQKFDGFWCAAVLLHIPRDRLPLALQAIKRNCKNGAIGFISVKEGSDEKVEVDTGTYKGRYFVYWRSSAFKKVLKDAGFVVLEEMYRPLSEKTKWLSYIVKSI